MAEGKSEPEGAVGRRVERIEGVEVARPGSRELGAGELRREVADGVQGKAVVSISPSLAGKPESGSSSLAT